MKDMNNNYVVLYKAKKGVTPIFIQFKIKAKCKESAKFKANKESGLKDMYNIESITEIKDEKKVGI